MSEHTILPVDDDPEIVKTLQRYLQHEGYVVIVAYNGKDALTIVREQPPDCIDLDVMPPDHNGWEITERIRDNPRTAKIPIVMLTARVDDTDKIFGLDLGADDYVTKPFNPHELLTRIRARLRLSQPRQSPQEFQVRELHMDVGSRTVTLAGNEVDLIPTEFDLLRTLMQNPGYVFARDELLEEAVGYTFEGLGRASIAISKTCAVKSTRTAINISKRYTESAIV